MTSYTFIDEGRQRTPMVKQANVHVQTRLTEQTYARLQALAADNNSTVYATMRDILEGALHD